MKRILSYILISALVCSMFCAEVYAKEKKLVFDEQNGKLVYETDDLQFMSFRNMRPGQKYYDRMAIENAGQNIDFDLYFRVIPVEQTAECERLLDYISMQISYQGEIIYRGNAAGKDYGYEGINLQNQIFFGTYHPNEQQEIDVEVMLSQETPKEYCEMLGKVNWRFTVVQKEKGETHVEVPTASVKTGDTEGNAVLLIQFLAVLSVILTAISFAMKKG